MPSGGTSALREEDWEYVRKCYEMARESSMEYEWMQWFIGGLVNEKIPVHDAAFAALIEWDLIK
jgi:hypothetical protein